MWRRQSDLHKQGVGVELIEEVDILFIQGFPANISI
jgi:hypothetical protein